MVSEKRRLHLERLAQKRKGQKTGKYKKCEKCGKEFYTYPSALLRKFCSMKCYSREGANNVFYRGGFKRAKRKRNTYEMNEWRKSVFERDNYICQECGIKGGNLNAHHIKPFAYFKELRFEIDNGITLCVKCHKKTENYGRQSSKFATC